jgi:hypothetical protein
MAKNDFIVNGSSSVYPTGDHSCVEPKYGLSKRELFSIELLKGMVSGYTDEDKVNGHFIPACEYALLVKSSIELTDELLKQLEE